MERPWWKSYPADVPREIDASGHTSLVALCETAFAEFAERPAVGNFGSFMRFAELDRASRAFAAWLQQVAGVARGERVALMMPNMLAYPVALLGALRAGAVVVNTNPQYTPRELAHQLQDAGARVIVIFESTLPTLAAIRTDTAVEHVVVSRLGDFMPWPKRWLYNFVARRRAPTPRVMPPGAILFSAAVAAGACLPYSPPPLGHDDLAFLQYTGGTTGRAKGAMLSHGNLVANVLQVVSWFGGRAKRGEEVVITALPLYHIYALTTNCFSFLSQGGLNYLITDPRDLQGFVRELKRVPFTTLTGVNTLFNALINHPGV